jgi:hypothetical protein
LKNSCGRAARRSPISPKSTKLALYLEFASPVCRSNTPDAHVLVSYTTKFPHSVQVVNLQMGSGVHTILEWSMWVYFDTPDDHHYALSRQFDKHEDFRGNELTNIPVRWNLPAGTIITIDRPHAECVADPDGAGLVAPGSCLTGQKVELVGL